MRSSILPAAFAMLGCVASASAQLTYVSQARSVFGRVSVANVTPVTDTVTAPDFQPFDQTSNANLNVSGNNFAYVGHSYTHQASSLQPFGITDFTDFNAAPPIAAGTGSASGESKLDVVFSVAAATPYVLSGVMPRSTNIGTPSEEARVVHLVGPGIDMQVGNNGAFSQAGILSPGQYELVVDGLYGSNFLINPTESAPNFNVSLAVPEPTTPAALSLAGLLMKRRRA